MMEIGDFELEIISLKESQVIQVEWVEVKGTRGCFLVCKGHSPIISILKKGYSLIYKEVEKTGFKKLMVDGGIFHMEEDKAKAIVDL